MWKLQEYLSILVIILPLVAEVAGNSTLGGNELILTKQDNGKEITVKPGDIIQIELKAHGSAGYMWEFDNLDNEYFELFKKETKVINQEKGFTGAPALEIWQLRTKKQGESEIKLHHYRVWEGKEKAIDTFNIKVKIL